MKKWALGLLEKADEINEDFPNAVQPDACKLKNLNMIEFDFPTEDVVRTIVDLNDKDCSKRS